MTWPFRTPSTRTLLLQLLKETRDMSQIVDDIKAENTVLVTKVDALIAAFVGQGTQITALQAQVADLLANGTLSTSDAAALQDVLSGMRAEVDKMTTVLPPAAPPVAG